MMTADELKAAEADCGMAEANRGDLDRWHPNWWHSAYSALRAAGWGHLTPDAFMLHLRDSFACVAHCRALLAERDKLAAFKQYVHSRLDAAGVPADPDSPHKAEGCRVGGRLDVVIGERDALLAEVDRLKDNMRRMVSGFRSHLGDLITRIGPARRPEDIRAKLEEIHNAYNGWSDRSAEAKRDRLREVIRYWSYCTYNGLRRECPEKESEFLDVCRELGIRPYADVPGEPVATVVPPGGKPTHLAPIAMATLHDVPPATAKELRREPVPSPVSVALARACAERDAYRERVAVLESTIRAELPQVAYPTYDRLAKVLYAPIGEPGKADAAPSAVAPARVTAEVRPHTNLPVVIFREGAPASDVSGDAADGHATPKGR